MNILKRTSEDLILKYPVKVLQFGEGNFLRGFVDWMIDIMNEKTDFYGAVQVVQPIEQGLSELINKQDGLYHVILQGLKDGKLVEEKRLIKCLKGVINPYKHYEEFLKMAENPDLEIIISNTTEAGIEFNESDKSLDTVPDSFPGKLTALLYNRFIFFAGAADKGLIIIPCELIDKNGDNLKNAVLKYIQHLNLSVDFKNWILENNIFCNSLVDRIVPGFPKENIKDIQKELNYDDNLVVKAEPFHLWVIEAPESVKLAFPVEKANLEVKFVKDLSPYRTRKVRILNGAHTSLVPVAYLKGLTTVKEAVDDTETGKFVRDTIFNEIIPTLDLPNDELQKFANDVIERFQNPFIKHEIISIALNSISKFKVRVLPSLLEYKIRKNKLPDNLVRSLAALIVFYKGEWRETAIPLNDNAEIITFFKSAWQKPTTEQLVRTILSNKLLWDQDLTLVEGLTEKTENYIEEFLKIENLEVSKFSR